MESVNIDENIRVGAAFDNRIAFPIWFMWRKRYYKIKKINFTWNSRNGITKIHHYAVSDEANMYEISFNSSTLEWTLCKVCGD